jgi:hypothetical protein
VNRIEDGGLNELSNLIVLCRRHHTGVVHWALGTDSRSVTFDSAGPSSASAASADSVSIESAPEQEAVPLHASSKG